MAYRDPNPDIVVRQRRGDGGWLNPDRSGPAGDLPPPAAPPERPPAQPTPPRGRH